MGTLQVSEVMDFTGGTNTVVAPHLIKKSEALYLVNADIDFGSLKSVVNLNRLGDLNGSHFVDFNNKVYSYQGWRSNTRQNNNLYWSDGKSTGKILWDGRELPLGITTPTTVPTISLDGSGPHKGDFKYTYTFYSNETDVESAPCKLPDYLYADSNSLKISGMQSLPANANRYRIYRIGGYLPRFTLVAEVETNSYRDSLDDTEIDGRLLHTMRCGTPPEGLKNMTELNGRLFGSVGTKIYFSALGNADAWYISDHYIMPSEVVGIASSATGLIILGRDYVYNLAGTSPQNFRLRVISNYIGCVAAESIAYIAGLAIWLSEAGVCTSNGSGIENITFNKIDNIDIKNITSSMVINNIYTLHFIPDVPGDPNILVMDFRLGDKYSFYYLKYERIGSIGNIQDKPSLSTVATDVIFMPCNEPLMCDSFIPCSEYNLNTLGDEQDNGLTTLVYASPQFVEGSLGTLKEYDKVRITFSGKFNVKVLFSGLDVVVEETIENNAKLTKFEGAEYPENQSVILGIPNNNNTSYSISFVIKGVGSIKSIQYSWKPRELP